MKQALTPLQTVEGLGLGLESCGRLGLDFGLGMKGLRQVDECLGLGIQGLGLGIRQLGLVDIPA